MILRQLDLAAAQEDEDLARHLVEDALENCVSAFDGFGREVVRRHSAKSRDPTKCERVSFQNLNRASADLQDLFGADLTAALSTSEWTLLNLAYMRRHLLAHRSGVIDQKYLDEAGEPTALLGRRLSTDANDVEQLVGKVDLLENALESLLANAP